MNFQVLFVFYLFRYYLFVIKIITSFFYRSKYGHLKNFESFNTKYINYFLFYFRHQDIVLVTKSSNEDYS